MIATDRLVLRPAVDADRDAIAALNAHPQVGAWLGGVRDRTESDAFVDRVQAHEFQHGFGFWAVERKADRRLIGMTGVWWVPPEMEMPDTVEIGWRFHPEAWGQGYATEAARAALAYGFEALKLPEIIAFTARTNLASQGVIRRIGMIHDPARDFDHPGLAEDHPLRAHVVFVAKP
ncbi:GNAT family N-acetyltransferase [Caulobacter sp.]|uniref:GNAT family N-acetyltransferase n=1 Tax=Caulobacter sp. TaxID=78 RepID=UPI001B0748EC|nr:GNAT family N-acetyltransferase [Caulobacter sp.]MBO9547796.1 GNAT family N-acetyltransferase [Caulobacter sp.]